MKKKHFSIVAFAALAAFTFSSCNNASPKMDEKSQTAQAAQGEFKIAYVEIDSIMTQYEFCKDFSKTLEQKGQNIQNTIAQKGQALQNAVANFQQNVQNNKYTMEQAQQIQANLQKQDRDLQALQQRLTTEFQTETEKYNTALRDSIQHFLASYNKDKKFSMILSRAGDNMLYADKTLDITSDVIAGLNKAYKPAKAAAPAAKKEEKKEEKK